MFADKLKQELNNAAPDWEWSCISENGKSPDLISPRLLSVSARNKQSGKRTSAIQVSNSPNADVQQAARFICDVLMVNCPEPALPSSPEYRRLS